MAEAALASSWERSSRSVSTRLVRCSAIVDGLACEVYRIAEGALQTEMTIRIRPCGLI